MKTKYICDVCGAAYDFASEAIACEEQVPPAFPKIAVGDIVTAHPHYGWFDGDPDWIINPTVMKKSDGAKCPNGDSNCFGPCCNYQFYRVVTSIDIVGAYKGRHERRYSVFTRAMTSQGVGGWTAARSHYRLTKIEPSTVPDKVRREAAALVGQRAQYLL